MEERSTWRLLLKDAIRSPHDRQQLAQRLGVNPITLTRWINHNSEPRVEFLRALPDALPASRQQLITLLEQEHPGLFVTYHTQETIPEIPSAFSIRFFKEFATLPTHIREASLCLLIIQQVLVQLDPSKSGMSVFLVLCTPPASGNPIRSLFPLIGRGSTPQMESHFLAQMQLFGIESQVGDSLQRGHLLVTQTGTEQLQRYSLHLNTAMESVATVPIFLADQAGGCLIAMSPHSSAFSLAHLDLLQNYAYMASSAVAPERFYPFSQIQLGVMPNFERQHTAVSTFQERIIRHLKEATNSGHLLTRPQAELLVWQELEQILLHLSIASFSPSK